MKRGTDYTDVLADAASAVGRGLLAGLAGTAAMTVSSTVEMKIRGRAASTAPADAAARVLGVEPTGDEARERFSNVVHWSYGTGWGAVRGLIGFAGLSGPAAAVTHLLAIWPAELIMLPSLGVAPSPWRWGATELGIDAFHHAVYVTVTGATFDALGGAGRR